MMKDKIIDVLKQCYDPELPIDLWSLGLIYEISSKELRDGKSGIEIIMTLTTPGCMMGESMANDINATLDLEPLKSYDNGRWFLILSESSMFECNTS